MDRRSMREVIEALDAIHPGCKVEVRGPTSWGRPPSHYELVVATVPYDENEGMYGDWIDHAALLDEVSP